MLCLEGEERFFFSRLSCQCSDFWSQERLSSSHWYQKST